MAEEAGQQQVKAPDTKSRVVPWYRDWLLLPIIGVVFLIDQATKLWVRLNIGEGQTIPSNSIFQITNVNNTGGAFGLFPNQTLLLIIASFIGIAVLVVMYRNQATASVLLRLSLALQLGGAGGNLLDRVTLGYVTDFIKLGFWPVFNLADASIVIGILMLAWILTTTPKPIRVTKGAGAQTDTDPSIGRTDQSAVTKPEDQVATPIPESVPADPPERRDMPSDNSASNPVAVRTSAESVNAEEPPPPEGQTVQQRVNPEQSNIQDERQTNPC